MPWAAVDRQVRHLPMPLFTLTVRHERDWLSTQLTAPDAQAGVMQFSTRRTRRFVRAPSRHWRPISEPRTLFFLVPLEGLTNVWAATAGHGGKYAEVVCCRTSGDD